ncbi:MAG: hypothetical protein ACAH88_09200 [Roseimicrobium sp.]
MEVIHALIGHLLVAGFIAFVLWSRKSKTKQVGRLRVLKYPLALRLFAAVTLGILVAGSSLLVSHTQGEERIVSMLMMMPTLVIAFLGAVETWLTHVAYDSDHIFYSSAWRASGTLIMDDVSTVKYSTFWGQYTFTGVHGDRIRVSKFLNGVHELLEAIEQHFVSTRTFQH